MDEHSIEEILSSLKQRVLNGETLNVFKKEISLLVEQIEKKDPHMDKLADLVGQKLSTILGKSEQEMTLMIKRSSLLNKKNVKKSELESTAKLIRQQIEATLKKLNKRSQIDYLDLKDLKPNFTFKLPDDSKTLVSHFKKIVEEFVAVNNDYVKTKINEEKAKVSKHILQIYIPFTIG